MRSAKNIVAFPKQREERRKDELAFLPAALEIVETPPSPIGRAIAFTIIVAFSVAVVWACIGTVDIVAVAPGKIIPSGRTKTIQPFETGVVRGIHVRDGQKVNAGDVVLELDPTMSGAELGHLKSDLMAAQLDAARLRAALAGKHDPPSEFKPPDGAPSDLIQMHRRFLVSQTAEQNAKMAAIDRQVEQKEAERAYRGYADLLNEDATGAAIDPSRPGLARELARMNLSLNFYTQWYWKTDLHNLMHFLSLRGDLHAQYEIRAYAEAMLGTLARWVPMTHAAFLEYRLNAALVSASTLGVIRRLLAGERVAPEASGLSQREWRELMAVLGRASG